MKEALVYINGKELSFAESMTLRVAVTSYLVGMEYEGLGDDVHGKAMSEGYSRNCKSIIEKIFINQ